ncbi:MAG: hypothetical protein ACK5LY_03445 [Lachnospirales bacterium]
MSRKIGTCCLVFILILSLNSCQLAKADVSINEQDKLIGVYLTKEYLDLFDFEGYINENINGVKDGEITINDKNSSDYEGRIYAEKIITVEKDSEIGEEIELVSYEFNDLEGIPFYYLYDSKTDSVSVTGDVKDVNVNIGDFVTSISGTASVIPIENIDNGVYVNPIYADENEDLYVMSGSGIMQAWNEDITGSSINQSIESKETLNIDGVETESVFKVEINVEFRYPTEEIKIIEMSKDDNMLKTNVLSINDSIQEVYEVDEKTEYIIVELISKDEIQRAIYEDNETYINYYIENDAGFCVPLGFEVKWE